jgi:hypothetical protein
MAYAHMAQLECRKAPATPASGRAAQDKCAAPRGDTHVPQDERGGSHSHESSDSAHGCAAAPSAYVSIRQHTSAFVPECDSKPQEERGRSHSQKSSDSAHGCAAVQSRATEDTEEEEEAAAAAAASWRRAADGAQQLLDSAEARFGVSLNAVSYAK